MAVFQRFFSDRDPKTMFETKAEADAHDRKLEAIEDLSVLLEQSAAAAKLKVEEDGLYKMAELLYEQHLDKMTEIVTGKKPRKAKTETPPQEQAEASAPAKKGAGRKAA